MTIQVVRFDSRVNWSEDATTSLKSLVAENKSGGQIAALLGVSRNAVIGKVHRLGLTLTGQKISTTTRAERRRAARAVGIARSKTKDAPLQYAKKSEERRLNEPPSRKLPVYELDFINDCRFPTSEEAPHVHCGQPRLTPGRDHISVYCEYHTIIARNQNHRQRGTGHGHLVYWSARSR